METKESLGTATRGMDAKQGNHMTTRQIAFRWRELVEKGILSADRCSSEELERLENEIFCTPQWDLPQLRFVTEITGRYRHELKAHGVYSPFDRMRADETTVREISIETNGGNMFFVVNFTFDMHVMHDFKRFIPQSSRNYDNVRKNWYVSLAQYKEIQSFAEKWGFYVSAHAERLIKYTGINYAQSYRQERVPLDIPLKKRLYDFQTVGVDFCRRVKRAWLTDEMGLGKTPQAIATMVALKAEPVLVICPKALRYNWRDEIHAWTHYKAVVLTSKNARLLPYLLSSKIIHAVIVSFDGIKTHFVKDVAMRKQGRGTTSIVTYNGLEKHFKGVIIDESHKLKNNRTQRFKYVKGIVKDKEFRVLCTGTPIVNASKDVAAQLDLLGYLKTDFGGYFKFEHYYGQLLSNTFKAGVYNRATTMELNEKLRTLCMIRREKHQVLSQLPDKVRRVITLPLENKRAYDQARRALQGQLHDMVTYGRSKSAAANILTQMLKLSRLSVEGKMNQFCEWLDAMVEQGEKVVIFVWHLSVIDMLKERYPEALEVSGRVTDESLQQAVNKFNTDSEQKLIIVTYKRGSNGLTLTAASHVALLEMGWTPADQDQAADRLHRIGQVNKVIAHYFLGQDTIDEHKYKTINAKRRIIRKGIDSKSKIETLRITGVPATGVPATAETQPDKSLHRSLIDLYLSETGAANDKTQADYEQINEVKLSNKPKTGIQKELFT